MKKNIIITGASGFLGTTVTKKFANDNVYAVIAQNDNDELIKEHCHEIYRTDVSAQDQIQNTIDDISKEAKSIEAAVLIVGGFAMGSFGEITSSEIQEIFTLNFETAFFSSQAIFNKMKEQNSPGHIFLIGARPGLKPAEGSWATAYALSKSLMVPLSEIINAEGKNVGIKCSVLVPSIIDTAVNREAMPDSNFEEWVKPEAIADTITFLLSDSGKNLSENVIKVYNKA